MKTNLILIEGLPGSGKSTYAKRIHEWIKQFHNTLLFQEGDLHPIDVCWCSILSEEKYSKLLEKYIKYKDQILDNSRTFSDKFIVAYTKVQVEESDHEFYKEMSETEIYAKNDLTVFKDFHKSLYQSFNSTFNSDIIYVFECVFLQNHINEHILKYDTNKKELYDYFNTMIAQLSSLHPVLIYIEQKDVEKTLSRISKERISPNKELYKDWIDNVVEYISKQPYAKKYNYLTKHDIIRYFIDRQNIELDLISQLPIPVYKYQLNLDYDEVYNMIIQDLNTIISKKNPQAKN